jgi:hypothetical protein
MKFNKWTMGLAAVGVVSLASAASAQEKMSQVQTALSNTTLSGYVDTSAMWQLGSQNGGPTPQYTPGGVASDGFNLNAVDIALDKPMDESPWAAGYHVELMTGPDAVPSNEGGVGIRQAYIALGTPVGNSRIDWKVGVWDTIIGYESSSDPLNPNYTRSLGYAVEPTTHTGILATYKVNDMVTVQAGVADASQVSSYEGYGSFGPNPINGRNVQESKKAYMGAIALTAPESWGWAKGATLNAGIINNDNGATDSNPGNWGSTSLYVGATVPTPMQALKVGAAFDYRDMHNAHWIGNSDSSLWVAGLYANYKANDKLSLNVRGEHLESNVDRYSPSVDEFTATVQYAIWANVLSRVEFRWDHVEHGGAFDANSQWEYDQYGSRYAYHANAYMLALNLIYQF